MARLRPSRKFGKTVRAFGLSVFLKVRGLDRGKLNAGLMPLRRKEKQWNSFTA